MVSSEKVLKYFKVAKFFIHYHFMEGDGIFSMLLSRKYVWGEM